MKKLIPAIAALSVCSVMLTGCGGEDAAGTQDDNGSVSAENTVSESAEISSGNNDSDNSGSNTPERSEENSGESDTSSESAENGNSGAETAFGQNIPADDPGEEDIPDNVPEEEIVFDEGDGNDEPETVTVQNPTFASLNEFAESEISMLPFESAAYGNSYTYKFISSIDEGKPLHLDVTDHTAGSFLSLYIDSKNSRLSMTVVREDAGMILPVIVSGSKMYVLDPVNMAAVYMNADKSIFTEMLSLIGIDKEAVSASKNIERCKVTVSGKEYTFEYSTAGGFLYDANGKPYAIVSNADSLDLTIMEINEFSNNIPEGIFDIPEDYELIEDPGAGS